MSFQDTKNEALANQLSAGKALSPLDGRYSLIANELAPYFSEFALVKNRVSVEIKWLEFILENIDDVPAIDNFNWGQISKIRDIYYNFSEKDFLEVKHIESITNHDVKSVELFIAERLKNLELSELVPFVHIGCTSEDITNCAYANMIRDALIYVWCPIADELITELADMAESYYAIPMLAHTHGQPATPTTVGKEFTVYAYRLQNSFDHINSIEICAKFNGATGNFSAISTAFPYNDWIRLSKEFVEEFLGLSYNGITTQIESHDWMCHLFDAIRHFNNVLLDFDVDMWLYISMDYFHQMPVSSEVGSSTMPHKVNPIRFENSESNIDMSNAILMALSNKLARSRMQRDLSDSSSQRNIGLAFGYSLQAIRQTLSGITKVSLNRAKISEDLNNRWEVLAEPIQTMLRKYGIPDAYNQLKELTRGNNISRLDIQSFIKSLDILSEEDMQLLLSLSPDTYIGFAPRLTLDEIHGFTS